MSPENRVIFTFAVLLVFLISGFSPDRCALMAILTIIGINWTRHWPTAWLSFRFAKLLYVMPLLFAYSPILFTDTTEAALWTIFTASLGTLAFAAWTMGYLVRAIGFVGGLVLALCTLGLFMPFDAEIAVGITGLAVNLLAAGGLIGFIAVQWLGTNRTVKQENNV